MSLAHSFDVKDPHDFLRGLSNALNEYDQSKEEGDRPKMVFFHGLLCLERHRRGSSSAHCLGQVDQNDSTVLPTMQYRIQMLRRHHTSSRLT